MNPIFLIIVIMSVFFSHASCFAKDKKYNIEVVWYGHSAVTLYDGKTRILIDPFFSGNPTASISWDSLPHIDYILLTHDHSDHLGDTIAIAKKFKAKVTGVVETMIALQQQGLPQELLLHGIGFNVGGTVQLGDFKVLMVPAFHSSTTGISVGYFITSSSGFRTYHAGDTAPFGDMKLWASWYPVDLAILPIGGYFTEDAFLTVKSVELINPQFVLPIHYATFPLLSSSREEFEKLMKKTKLETKLLLPQPGQVLRF